MGRWREVCSLSAYMRRFCGFLIAGLFVSTAAGAASPTSAPTPPPSHVQVAVAARPMTTPAVRLPPPPHDATPVHETTAPHELHLGPVADPKAPGKVAMFVKVVRDPTFAVSVANFAAKAALAFSHQGWPMASAAAASLGVVFAGLALWRNPKEWGSLPWTTASLGFTGAAAAASLFDPSVSGYLFDAAVATSLPGIASAGRAAVAMKAAAPAAIPTH